MEKSYFFNSVNGDRKANADDWSRYFSSFIGNGVYNTNSLLVTSAGDMKIKISAGTAFLNGRLYENTNDLEMTIDGADGALKRIDKVVLRYRQSERDVKIFLKKGELSSTPVAAELEQNESVFELGIADVFIDVGAVNITQSKISDLRLTEQCGLVTSVIEQLDTSVFAQQLQGVLNTNQQDFESWFNNLQDLLTANAETNLLTLINANTAKLNEMDKPKQSTSIATTSWQDTAEYGEYIKYADINIAGLTAADFVDVVIKQESEAAAQDAELSSYVIEMAGKVRVLAKKAPAAEILIEYKVVI